MKIKNKGGQSTVEYVLLVTAVLACVITFVSGNASPFQAQLNQAYNAATQGINTEGNELSNSRFLSGPTQGNTGIPQGYVVDSSFG